MSADSSASSHINDTDNLLAELKILFEGTEIPCATVTSWVSGGNEHLFLSESAVFNGVKAIRGGIPIVFPNFGPWTKGPQHGFARISTWKLVKPMFKDIEGNKSVILTLGDNEFTRNMWNYLFLLELKVTLGESEFEFTALLHTYLKVDDIANVDIDQLSDLTYQDKIENGEFKQISDILSIDKNVDRIYMNTSKSHRVADGNSVIIIDKFNFPDTVIWNPWIEKAKNMGDFDDEGYKSMICVEAGRVSASTILKPNDFFECGQILSIIKKI